MTYVSSISSMFHEEKTDNLNPNKWRLLILTKWLVLRDTYKQYITAYEAGLEIFLQIFMIKDVIKIA